MKRYVMTLATAFLSLISFLPSFASDLPTWRNFRTAELELSGRWHCGSGTDSCKWWYERPDGSYPASCWRWIDGNDDGYAECYYFNSDGRMAESLTTSDGFAVDQSGAWTKDGERQLLRVLDSEQREFFTSAAKILLSVYGEYLKSPDFRYVKPDIDYEELAAAGFAGGDAYTITGYDEDFDGVRMYLKFDYTKPSGEGEAYAKAGSLYLTLMQSSGEPGFYILELHNQPAFG